MFTSIVEPQLLITPHEYRSSDTLAIISSFTCQASSVKLFDAGQYFPASNMCNQPDSFCNIQQPC